MTADLMADLMVASMAVLLVDVSAAMTADLMADLMVALMADLLVAH